MVAMYSQNNEQQIIADFFTAHPPKYGKRLLDVGAWDGVHLSNSRALVEAQWAAVLVEAAAGPFVRLMDACRGFNNTRLVQAFIVGSATPVSMSRLVTMQHTQDAVSTADPTVHAAWKDAIKDYFPIMVPVVRVTELLDAFGGPFDLITLDTEGETFAIFCDILAMTEASCIVVEHAAGGVTYAEQMRGLAAAHGYTEIGFNGENLIFAKV